MASKEKPRRDSSERWLLTRKTWRYMADAGRRLIPEGWSPEAGASGYQQLESEFQNVCKKEKSFLLWPRKKRADAAEEVDEEPVSSCLSDTPTTLGADSSLTGSDDEITVIEDQDYLAGPGAPMFDLVDGAYGASSEAYRSVGSRAFSSGSRVAPVGFDAADAEELKERLRHRQEQTREQEKEEEELMVTVGESLELEQDGVKKAMRHMGVQTDSRLQEPLLPLPPVETDSGKGTEAEVSTPETPLSPVSVVDSRADPYCSPTSVTSGVSVFGDLCKESTALKPPPKEPGKEAPKKEEPPSPMLDRFGDKLSRYMKMARRDSATRDKDKKDRFKTVNYDKTLRNIKSKRINADTLEDMSEDIKPLDLDDPPKSALPAAIRSGGKVTRAVGAAATPAASGTAVSAAQQPPDVKKRKRRGIQVGEPLPQYILDSLRGAFVSFRSMRKLSKAESELSASADDKSVDPLSPRYSITVSDDLGTRDLTLSDVESSTVPPFSLYSSARTSLDVTGECTGDEIFTGPRAVAAGGGGSHETQAACTTVSTHASKASISSPCASPVPVIAGCVQRTSSSPQAAASSPGKPGFFARRKSSAKPPQAHPSPGSTLQQQQQQQQQQLLQQQQQPPGSKRGFFSTVMQKSAKTAGNHGSRVVAKKLWKSRSKSQSRTSLSSACVWTPQASCQWVNIQSRAVTLCDTSLLQLSEIEAAALQQVALEKLTDFNLGCTVRIPKDFNVTAGHKPKRRAYLLKKRPLTTGFFDTAKHDEKGDGGAGRGLVFGIPLQSCMENDRRLRQRGATPLRERLQGPAPAGSRSSHGGSHASFSSLIDAIRDKTTGSCESLNLMDKRSSVQDSSLSLASDAAGETSLQPHVPQIPLVLSTCIRHIETYGLQTVGVFRVSSSKKRSRQLREDFDSGADVKLSEELCPHDVATLIKEFFRDLPEPLLPHDLYQPFLATQKIRNRRQQFECLQHLIQLLAVPNRDTLWALLCFLKKVADNAVDRRSNTGDWLTGNKMDSNNLATLFAPNMLHSLTNVGGAEMAQQTAERIDVINVVRSLIDHNNDLFQVSSELLHEAYQVLMERQPEALDILLRRRLQTSDDVDLELDTSSSVFEGSECSSQPAPTSERERSREGTEENRRVRRRDASVQDPASSQAPPERSRRFRRRQDGGSGRDRSRRRDKSGSREDLSSGGGGGGGGWFRRRVRSSSSTRPPSEEARSSEERPATRWFRRRDKSQSQSQSQASDSGSEAQQRRRGSLQAADRPLLMRTEVRQRSTSDQTVAGPAPPSGGQRATPRRLSSPELDVSGVITASLKIPVPAAARSGGPATGGVSPGEDIPYIEECQTVSGAGHDEVFLVRTGGGEGRHRHESSGSESQGAAEPITGSLSIQPLSRSRSGLVGEHGFVVATSSGGAVVARPQLRLLPAPLPAEAQISRSASASQVVSVPTEAAATVLPPPPAAAPRRSRPRPPEHVTHGQLLLPAGTAEVARSRTSPNISQQSAQMAAPAPTATPRRRHISHSSSSTEVAAEPRSRRREEPAPVRRSRRVAGRSVTANVYELQKAEAEPAVWKRRQLIASDSQTGV